MVDKILRGNSYNHHYRLFQFGLIVINGLGLEVLNSIPIKVRTLTVIKKERDLSCLSPSMPLFWIIYLEYLLWNDLGYLSGILTLVYQCNNGISRFDGIFVSMLEMGY